MIPRPFLREAPHELRPISRLRIPGPWSGLPDLERALATGPAEAVLGFNLLIALASLTLGVDTLRDPENVPNGWMITIVSVIGIVGMLYMERHGRHRGEKGS